MLQRKELSKKADWKVMNAFLLLTLVYGSEVWNLLKQQETVQATQIRVLQRIEGESKKSRQGEKCGYT